MLNTYEFVYVVVFLAFVFDFLNGLHDAPNSIATMVVTRVLNPLPAVCWAAFFNFTAFLVFKLKVANTIGAALILPSVINPSVLFCTLVGAISWNLITWYFGLPSSSSHALIGGLIGSAFIVGGISALNFGGLLPVISALILSPTIGLIISTVLISLISRYFPETTASQKANRWIKASQFISSAFLSLAHGGNDAQKTMGLISVLLYSSGLLGEHFYVPFWVMMSCNFIMGLGTLFGGWRIVNTMGKKITPLTPVSGSCIATSAALTLLTANEFGLPISTTHTVTGAIVGSGLSKGLQNVYWPTVYRILWSWLFTIPLSGLISGSIMYFIR